MFLYKVIKFCVLYFLNIYIYVIEKLIIYYLNNRVFIIKFIDFLILGCILSIIC